MNQCTMESPLSEDARESAYPLMANRPIQRQQLSPFRELYAQGVRTMHVDATFSEDIFHPELRVWKSAQCFDYSFQASYWERIIEVCPDAMLCLRLYAGSPPWWDEQHPEELQRYADGSQEAEFQRSERRTLPSLGSEVWRKAACSALSEFVQWLEESGWSSRIWGLFLCYGITWEWGILGTDKLPDYSEPMKLRFREWLKETYGDEAALQECWGDSRVTFENAEIPTLERRTAGEGDLRLFPRDRAAADFQNCLSDANCDYLLALGETVRRVAGNKYKLGTFYGYTLTAREHSPFASRYGAGGLAGGHHAFGKFLRSGLFDFNASPYAYANRELGQGCLIQHFPRASCQKYGVHVYDENDLRTFLVAGSFDDRTISVGQTETLEQSLQHQRWALAQALCHQTSYWWTELTDWIGPYQPNFDHPALLAELRTHIGLFNRLQPQARASLAEVAIIIDERSLAALSLGSELFKTEVYEQLAAWSWCGAPFDVFLAEDVDEATMSNVRLAYVFCPAPSRKIRAALKQVLCCGGRTVWWGPLSGWQTDDGRDSEAFSELTEHGSPETFGSLRCKAFPGWVSLYGACARLAPGQLAQIAKDAGVWNYGAPPFHVMRGARFLAFQASSDGLRQICLPPGAEWEDASNGEKVQSGEVAFQAGETLLLRALENRESVSNT